MIKLSQFLWVIPFLSFLTGYYLLYSIFYVGEVMTPNIIGKPLNEGIEILSNVSLNLRILKEKEADLQEGLILDQSPSPGKVTRPNTHVFAIVSKKPKQIFTPDFIGLKTDDVVHSAISKGISTSVFRLQTPYPSGKCFAQYPAPQTVLGDGNVIVYVSSQLDPLCVVPSFNGQRISDVCNELDNYAYVEVVHRSPQSGKHVCKKCVVVEQRPMAGSIIDSSKKLHIQLLVEKKR